MGDITDMILDGLMDGETGELTAAAYEAIEGAEKTPAKHVYYTYEPSREHPGERNRLCFCPFCKLKIRDFQWDKASARMHEHIRYEHGVVGPLLDRRMKSKRKKRKK